MLAVMRETAENLELPEGWTAKEYQLTGHRKIYAVFENQGLRREVQIVPYNSYDLPGFTNCHRITLTKDDSIEVVAEGLEVEHADEAEKRALEVMESN